MSQADVSTLPRTSQLLPRYGRYAMLPALVAIVIYARVETPTFFTWSTFSTVLSQNATLGIVAVGLTFTLIAGGIDISVGATYAAGAAVFAKVAVHHSLGMAFAAAIVVGLVAGAINAVLVTRLTFNSFVVTLGTGSIFGGLVLLYSGPDATYPSNPSFGSLGNGSVGSVPNLVVFMLAALLVGGLVLHRTSFGKSLFAVGGNLPASRLAGLRTNSVRSAAFLISGGLAAFAGLLSASQSGSGTGDVGGMSLVVDALVVVVIGGTSLFGGEGAMWRTSIGILFMATLNNVFDVLAVTNATRSLVQGAILVTVLALDAAARERA
jgi:ribose transport system permease protein